MSLAPGTRLGPYEILASIGDGSDARYKASDTRANRVVTLTVLPAAVSAHPAVKARLERDARTISSLHHPQICAPVDVGHQDPETDFVVTEYLEGETLTQRLTRGPLELQEALSVAIAIADALDKAHRKGVTHGGLNPSVVMLTPSGPKLLDFGLAKLQDEAVPAGAGTMATTRTSIASLASVPSFAAPYTSPEQFAGSVADARSDIFALGAILYEMVAGRAAFQEKTLALLIAAVQTVDPEPVSKVQPMAPPALDYVIRRCLAKEPKQRLQTAWDLMSELRWVAEGSTQVAMPVMKGVGGRTQERGVWAALATLSIVAIGLVPSLLSRFEPAADPEAVRFVAASLPTAVVTPLALSPDGRWLAVSPGGLVGAGVVALSRDAVIPQLLIKENNVTQPFWSPDSRSLAFVEDGKLKRADVAGGPAQIICDVVPPVSVGTWNSDGVILVPSARLIQRVLAAGGQPTPVTALDESKQEVEHVAPVFLPDGRHFLFLAVSSKPGESAVYVGSLDSTERMRLFAADSRTVYAAPGYLLFNRADTVFAQGFDAGGLTLRGEPIRVASGVSSLGAGVNTSPSHARWAAFAVSQNGVLAYRSGGTGATAAPVTDEQRSLFWVDRTGARGTPIGTAGAYAGLDLSPDGRRFVVHRHEGNGGDNWFFDLSQGRMQRLTFDVTQDNSSPVWSPDGARVAFGSQRKGRWGLYVKAVDGAASEELIIETDGLVGPTGWSPDGKFVVYTQQVPPQADIFAVPVSGDKKPIPLVATQFPEQFAQVSPDGKWLAYQANEGTRAEIYVKPFPDGPGKWQVSTDGGTFPRWRHDGKELYFYFAGNLSAVDVRATESSIEPGVPRVLFGAAPPSGAFAHAPYNRFAVTADGQRFLISQPAGTGVVAAGGLSDAIIANVDRAGGGPGAAPNSVSVVLNWQQLLKAK